MGNRFQRIGFSAQAYYLSGFAQVNAEISDYQSFSNLGPPAQYNELVTEAGLAVGYGAKQAEYNPVAG